MVLKATTNRAVGQAQFSNSLHESFVLHLNQEQKDFVHFMAYKDDRKDKTEAQHKLEQL